MKLENLFSILFAFIALRRLEAGESVDYQIPAVPSKAAMESCPT
jgi:hypothetical protein